jgi:hypothetical protein
MGSLSEEPVTVCYKLVSEIPILLDVYLPPLQATQGKDAEVLLPFLIYFHAGGLTVGNKKSYFPTWLYSLVIFSYNMAHILIII